MSKITQILIEDEDERHGPPSQNLLRLSYSGPGLSTDPLLRAAAERQLPAVVFIDVVKCGDLNQKTGDYEYEQLGAVTVTAKTLEAALELLKSNDARGRRADG